MTIHAYLPIVKIDTEERTISWDWADSYLGEQTPDEGVYKDKGEGDRVLSHLIKTPTTTTHWGHAPTVLVERIVRLLSEREWDSDTPDEIARILIDAGYEIAEPEELP
jgi:hypothetical protein